MHFRRVVWTTVLVVSLAAGLTVQAENDNPFAKWEKQRQSAVQARDKAPASATGTVKYFSGEAERKKETDAPKTGGVKRERLSTAAASGSPRTNSGTSVRRPAGEREKSAFEPFRPMNADDTNTRSSGSVREASFRQPKDSGPVRQVSGESPNPFAEFLGEAEAEAESEIDTSRPEFNPPAADVREAEVEIAAPVGLPRPEFNAVVPDSSPKLPASLQGPQTPRVTLRWNHHDEFTVGQKCRCDLVVENSGESPVRDVTAEIVLPKGVQVVSAEPAPSTTGVSARWTYAQLEPGEKKTIQLVVIPKQSGDVQMNAFVQLTAAAASAVAVTQPDVAIKIEGPGTVEVGQQVGYTVHVTNPGTGTAQNVVIQAAVPEGLEHRQGNLLTIDIGTLSPGELRRARLSLTAVDGGEHQLAVRVLADGNLTRQTTQVVEVAEPKLNIGLRGPQVRKTGQDTDYEVVVVNEGKVESSNVRAKYRVPEGFEFVRTDAGGKFNPADRTIEWFVGTLEPNRVRQYRVTLKAVESGESTHQVGVISEHGQMTLAETSTAVEGSAELAIEIAAANEQVRKGENTVFEIRIVNSGTTAANSVGLSCELPPGLQLLEVSGPSEFIADNGVIIFRSLPSLEAGKSAVFAISAQCRRAGQHKLRARVASESVSEPLIGEGTTIGRDR